MGDEYDVAIELARKLSKELERLGDKPLMYDANKILRAMWERRDA